MEYRAGIYANDALLLDEVTDYLDVAYPKLYCTVYSGEDYLPELSSNTSFNVAENLDGVGEEDVLIVLSDPGKDFDVLKKFDGSLIDLTGVFNGHADDFYEVSDPIEFILSQIDVEKTGKFGASISLPASFFGRNGVEDLLSQTRSLFSFQKADNLVFDGRISFNILEAGGAKPNMLSGYKKKIDERFGINAAVRIIPVSTAFMLDLFYTKNVKMDFSEPIKAVEAGGYLVDQLPTDFIALEKNTGAGRDTLFGDYIKGLVIQIALHLKEILGE